MKRKLIFLQVVLCMILFLFYVTITLTAKNDVVTAGSFGKTHRRNVTFEDYIYNTYGDLF